MNFLYSRRGGPLLSWADGYAPRQARAAEATALGCDCHKPKSMGDPFRPGSPEAIGSYIAVSDATTPPPMPPSYAMSTTTKILIGGGILAGAYFFLGKKR